MKSLPIKNGFILHRGGAGFTLVELLVVIMIIVILTTIGVVIYGNAQSKANRSKMIADIDAITKSYETNYDTENRVYLPLTAEDFTTGKVPTPPANGNYNGLLTSNSSSFQVCANLEGTTACNSISSSCYCRKSAQGTFAQTSGICSNFKMGTTNTQQCKHSCIENPPAVVNIRCSSFSSNLNCSRSDCYPAMGPFPYTSQSGSSGSVTVYGSSCACGPITVNVVL